MNESLPFKVTPEVHEVFRKCGTIRGVERGLMFTLGYDARDPVGEITEELKEEHYSICGGPRSFWTKQSAIRLRIGRRKFWFTSSDLNRLKGKTLTVVRREVGRGKQKGRHRHILVAI